MDRLRAWLGGAPIDIDVLRLRVHTAANYAIGHAAGDDYAAFLDSVQAWNRNLKERRYARVVSVLLAFQWSDPALGPPWTRVDECAPPARSAGAEIEAIFLAERVARMPNLRDALARARVNRVGPLALFDASVLGLHSPPTTRATPLGQALTIEHALDPVEREIICRMDAPVAVSDLLAVAREFHLDNDAVLVAMGTLIRKGLVRATFAAGHARP